MYDFAVNTALADGLVPSSTLTFKGTVMNKVGSCIEVGLALEWLTLQKNYNLCICFHHVNKIFITPTILHRIDF